jgi:hypothetical protein
MQLLTRVLTLAALAVVLLVGGSDASSENNVQLVHNPPICC